MTEVIYILKKQTVLSTPEELDDIDRIISKIESQTGL
jgi:hypothetical protein